MNLKVYLSTKNMTCVEFADRVGCTNAALCRIMYGKQVCSKELAKKIEDETQGKVKLRLDTHIPDINYEDIVTPTRQYISQKRRQLAATA